MPAPKENTNARKGKQNRQMYSVRLPIEAIKFIKSEANRLNISQADLLIGLVTDYEDYVSEPTKNVYACTHCDVTFTSDQNYHGQQHDGCTCRASNGDSVGYWFKVSSGESIEGYNYVLDDFNFDAAREDHIFGRNYNKLLRK